MSINLRIVLLIIVLIYLLVIVKQIKKKKLQINFCIIWIVISTMLLVAVCIPNFIENISEILGFEVASNMVFCLTIFISFYLIFILTLRISQENAKTRELIQEISILNKKVEVLEGKNKKDED